MQASKRMKEFGGSGNERYSEDGKIIQKGSWIFVTFLGRLPLTF